MNNYCKGNNKSWLSGSLVAGMSCIVFVWCKQIIISNDRVRQSEIETDSNLQTHCSLCEREIKYFVCGENEMIGKTVKYWSYGSDRWRLQFQYQDDAAAPHHFVPPPTGNHPGEHSEFSVQPRLCESGGLRGILQPQHWYQGGTLCYHLIMKVIIIDIADKNMAWRGFANIPQVQFYGTFEDKTY